MIIYVTNERERVIAERVAADAVLTDPNCNGLNIVVQRGDYLSIEGGDEIVGIRLLSAIYDALRGDA